MNPSLPLLQSRRSRQSSSSGSSSKRLATENPSELAYSLQKRHIFTESEWRLRDPEQFARHGIGPQGKMILLEARKTYCNFSLYQTLINNAPSPCPTETSSRMLASFAEREGFNLFTLTYMLGRWLSDYTISRLHDTINTLYVVGDSATCADTFTNSILRMFHCVLTSHINDFDFERFVPVREVTKLIYFPSLHHDFPFKNPLVNEMLRGRSFNVPYQGELVEIEEIKCVVRLNKLPRPDQLPTNPKFHLIIQFDSPNDDGASFLASELVHYLRQLREHEGDRDFDCKNDFGVLCSTAWIDPPCSTCRQHFDHILSLPD
ncbi:ORF12 [Fowl aviadenovirus E]|uniref:ORF12 n=1 Tax=Fowl aviadenovirus E TaxID=190065 RepID=A0A650BZG1_9ADEN|nr:ORF12 [Fowl aviadenovirus E]